MLDMREQGKYLQDCNVYSVIHAYFKRSGRASNLFPYGLIFDTKPLPFNVGACLTGVPKFMDSARSCWGWSWQWRAWISSNWWSITMHGLAKQVLYYTLGECCISSCQSRKPLSCSAVKYPRPKIPGAETTAAQISVYTKEDVEMEVENKSLRPRVCIAPSQVAAAQVAVGISVAAWAEIPLRSPRKLFIFIIKKIIYWVKVSKNKIK